MEAGTILMNPFVPTSIFRRQSLLPRFVTVVSRAICFSLPHSVLKLTVSCSQKENGLYRGPKPRKDWAVDWVPQNESTVRRLPIYVGGASLLAVLLNRAVSGIAPVADAGSSQSRADLLALGLSVTNILTGLVWLSIRAKTISVVNPEGVECRELLSNLPEPAVSELMWAWESLSTATCCRSLVVIYDGKKILQIGVAALSPAEPSEPMAVDAEKLMQGTLYQGVMRSKAQNYLANLALYPGKSELPFLPTNTQAVILQPLGDKGIAIIGGDTIRGFTTSDQTWIAYIGEKLDATLAKLIGGSSLPVEEIIC